MSFENIAKLRESYDTAVMWKPLKPLMISGFQRIFKGQTSKMNYL